MPVINFSAVAATDVFTSVAHGLNTGDGAAQTLVPGGATGGLNETLDYYIRRIDADTYTLHPTAADALANTGIVNVTADTRGQLAIGLPFRRARTYVAGSQLKSVDLNFLQDSLVGKKHGLVKVEIAPVIVNNGVGWALQANDTIKSTAAGLAQLFLPCEVGDVILGVELQVKGDGVADATVNLWYVDSGMARFGIASTADVNRAAAWGTLVVSALTPPVPTPHTMAAGERLRVEIDAAAANYEVGQITLIKHRGA